MKKLKLAEAQSVGIVVTHNPSRAFENTLNTLAPQVSKVVIIDNGSNSQSLEYVRTAALRHRSEVIANPENRGIATALNQGLDWALRQGRTWALLVDQDTLLHNGAVASLEAIYESHPERDALAITGANFVDPSTGEAVLEPPTRPSQDWFSSIATITSGSLLSLSAYRKIGPFRDDFFIDHVDTEYCLRAKTRGFIIAVSAAPLMVHSIGIGSVITLFGEKTWTSNHSPTRRYYVARNCIVLAKEYWRSDFWYVAYLLRQLLKSMVLVAFFENQKGSKLLHSLIGLFDGLRGRLGPYGRTNPARTNAGIDGKD